MVKSADYPETNAAAGALASSSLLGGADGAVHPTLAECCTLPRYCRHKITQALSHIAAYGASSQCCGTMYNAIRMQSGVVSLFNHSLAHSVLLTYCRSLLLFPQVTKVYACNTEHQNQTDA
jgi:hypothetical protein